MGVAEMPAERPLVEMVSNNNLIVVGTLTNFTVLRVNEAGSPSRPVDDFVVFSSNDYDYSSGTILVREVLKGRAPARTLHLTWKTPSALECPRNPNGAYTNRLYIWFLHSSSNTSEVTADFYAAQWLGKREQIMKFLAGWGSIDRDESSLLRLKDEEATRIRSQSLPCPYKIGSVDDGGTLSGIAALFYGDASKWPAIHKANKTIIKDPDHITPGMVILVPKLEDHCERATP